MPRSSPTTPHSAGLLLFRQTETGTEVLLVHPGGPLWRNRWSGWWQIPKGGLAPGEDPLAAARREAAEELGQPCHGPALPLGEVRQSGGKRVRGFAVEQDLDPALVASNTFTIEWPPTSGRQASFPEIDQARWFPIADAEQEMLPSQRPFLARLQLLLAS